MNPTRLRKGDVCVIDENEYEFARRLLDGRIQMEHIETGMRITKTDLNLAEDIASGRAVYREGAMKHREPIEVRPWNFASLPEDIKKKASRNFGYLTRLAKRGISIFSSSELEPALKEIAEELGDEKPPARSTIFKWRKKAGPNMEVRNLVDNRHFRDGQQKLDEDVRDIKDEIVSEFYMSRRRPTIKNTHALICAKISEINQTRDADEQLKWPSYDAVRDHINRIDEYSRAASRHGKEYADAKFSAVGKGPVASHPLAVAELDHTKVDVMVLDDVYHLPLGRPWVVFLIDRRTRMPLGFHITFDPPSVQTVAQCLKNAIQPKSYVSKDYPDIKNVWPCYGVPTWIVFDRAMENLGKDIEEMANALGFHVAFCPRKKAHYKGMIERMLGTFNRQLIQGIPGTTFSNIAERGDYNSVKEAVVTFSELRELIHGWIINDYIQAFHRGLKGVPVKVWEREIKHHPIRPLPDREKMEAYISRTEERVLSRKGIEFENLFYMHEDVVAWRSDSKFQKASEKTKTGWKVNIRYNPTDMSKIWVIDPRTYQPVEVPCTDQAYTNNLNLWQHRAIKEYLRKELEQDVNLENLYQARADREAKVQDLLSLRRPRRRTSTSARAAREAGYGSTAPAGDTGSGKSTKSPKPHTNRTGTKKSRRPKNDPKSSSVVLPPAMSSDDVDVYAD